MPVCCLEAKCDLTICRLTETSGPVAGGKEILLFCDKIAKDDIQIRFFEEAQDGTVVWEALGDFQPSDVHKQYGICFRTPRYKNLEVGAFLLIVQHSHCPKYPDRAAGESAAAASTTF